MDMDVLLEHLILISNTDGADIFDNPFALEPHTQWRHQRTFREMYEKYGKNFINMHRKMFTADPIYVEEFNVVGNQYLSHVAMEAECQFFQRYLQMRNGWFMGYFHKEFFKTAEKLLSEKTTFVSELGATPQQPNFGEWAKKLENKCKTLNKRYPGFFCNRLSEFLVKVEKPINNDKVYPEDYGLDEDEDEPLAPNTTAPTVPPPPPPTTNNVEPDADEVEETPSAKWSRVMETIESYKFNFNCGFMYSVLDFWLTDIAEHMRCSLEHTVPRFWQENRWRYDCITTTAKPVAELVTEPVRNITDQKDDEDGEPEAKKMKVTNTFVNNPFPNRYNGFSNYIPPKEPNYLWR